MSDEPQKGRKGNPLATPEELSRRISIVDAKGKFAVGAGIVLAVVLLAWSVFGSVPEMVPGSGILVPPDGLMDVVSLGQGQVTEVDIAPGDTIASGDILARISMPELEAQRQSILSGLKKRPTLARGTDRLLRPNHGRAGQEQRRTHRTPPVPHGLPQRVFSVS